MEPNQKIRLKCCTRTEPLHQQQQTKENIKMPLVQRRCHNYHLLLSLSIISIVLLLLMPTEHVLGRESGPQFISDMNMHTIKENTPIGQEVYELLAQDPSGAKVIYGIEETNLFGVDKLTGKVKVINNIDFETTGANLKMVVTATTMLTSQQLQQKIQPPTIKMSIDVNILDENDNIPKITQLRVNSSTPPIDALLLTKKTFKLDVSEDTQPNTILIEQIQASDRDTIGETPLSAFCSGCDNEFELVASDNEGVSNSRAVFALRTKNELNYVPKNNIRYLTLIVTDGKFNSNLTVEINILDQQNKAPIFVGSTTTIVPENIPLDTVLMTIKAVDGDAVGDLPHQIDTDHQRQVVYRFVDSAPQSASKYFRLNLTTGTLSVANRLDREEFLSTGGVISFQIQAIEVRSSRLITELDLINGDESNILDYGPNGSSETMIKVLLTDVNDNAPQWLNSTDMNNDENNRGGLFDTGRIYEVNIEENSPPGTPLALFDMYVQDIDSSPNNQFKIELLLNPSGKFDVEPKFASGHTSVSLRVAQQQTGMPTTMFDYENPNERKFVLQVIATELFTNESRSSIATVKVNVIDLNDNPPEFKSPYYRFNVKEDALYGRNVGFIEATDKDMSQIFYSLSGHSAKLFDIDETGKITVAKCIRVNPSDCIDYETQNQHHLLVQANDGELSAVVPLTIYVEDVSDNPPIMVRDTFSAVIEEGYERFESPLRVEAKDADTMSAITYSIVDGNFEGIFSIDSKTGEIQLKKRIKLKNNGQSTLKLIVEATDDVFRTNATVLIEVLDSNDNAPKFQAEEYSFDVNLQQMSGKQFIKQLIAEDADTGLNSKLSYRIQRGSFGMFDIDENTGNLYIENGAHFETDKKSLYDLEVIAIDHGLTSKTGTAKVHIMIIDSYEKPPQFTPNIQKVELIENVTPQTVIYRMRASSYDTVIATKKFRFTLESIEARNKNGNSVSDNDMLKSKLSIDSGTGDVIVNEKLDHDQLAYINLTISLQEELESDLISNEKSYGYLQITVKDYNENPPTFAPPWSLLRPELYFTMEEEKPIGTIIAQLMASDIDSKISYFKIDPPSDYFDLVSPQSGTIVNKRVIDYDKLMSQQSSLKGNTPDNILQFNVSVFDSGVPLLSAQARIFVEILPVNDWDCKFTQPVYNASIKRNSPDGTFVVQTIAHDNDWGQHGRLAYRLHEDHSSLFTIDTSTGTLKVGPRGLLTNSGEPIQLSSFTLHVIATDNAKDQFSEDFVSLVESRTCSVPVYMTIEDMDDFSPKFMKKTYEVSAYDGDYSVTPIVKLSINHHANPENTLRSLSKKFSSQYFFRIVSGNSNELFNITDQGQIYSTKRFNLTTTAEYHLKVEVSQKHQSIDDQCEVIIKVIPMNRHSPELVFPVDGTAYVNESSPINHFVAQVKCIDRDYGLETSTYIEDDQEKPYHAKKGYSDQLRYSFRVDAVDVQETDEFLIDAKSGNITTKVSLDREMKSYYNLMVICNDNGLPQALETLSPLTIYVLDIDDNKPEFVLTTHQRQQNKLRQLQIKTGQPKVHFVSPMSVEFQVDEGQGRNMIVGEVKAIDQDEIGGPLRYCIIDGNEYQEFHIDRDTGVIYTNQTLDREKQSSYILIVMVINDGQNCEDHITSMSRSHSLVTTGSVNSIQINKSNQKIKNTNFVSSLNNNSKDNSMIMVKIQVNDVNDNKPIFKKTHYKAGVKHRALVNTSVTQVPTIDPDNGINASVSYTISSVLLYKKQNLGANNNQYISQPKRLGASPFRIDQNGFVYTTKLLTQYPLTSMFSIDIEAQEKVAPNRKLTTKLDIWTYETYHQVKIKVNMSPKRIEAYKEDFEDIMSNITKYSAIINDIKSYHDSSQWIFNNKHNTDSASTFNYHDHSNTDENYPRSIANRFASHLTSIFNENSDETSASNLYLIFVDEGNKLVNPQSVIERFDLSSAHLFRPHDSKETDPNQQRVTHLSIPIAEPFIDNIALASSQVDSFQQYSIFNSDIFDIPTLFVIVTVSLTFIGTIMMCIGCCCMKNWYRDHLIRQATKKLIKQHAVKAKINEQMMAAAAIVQQQQDIMSASSANMTSLDAINCTNNNNDNISIIRAMNANNNSALQGIVNQGAHFYDSPHSAMINDNIQNNGIATIRGGLTNAQRRQQLPNDDPLTQKIQPMSWDEEKMTTNNEE